MREFFPVTRLPTFQDTAPPPLERSPDQTQGGQAKIELRSGGRAASPVTSDGHAGPRDEPGRLLDVIA
jgi:hypothetical protein